MFRGQSTLELLILFAGGMLALIVVAAVLPSQAIGSSALRDGDIARDTVSTMARVADEVYLSGDGATRTIWINLPETTRVSSSFVGARAGETNWSRKKMISLNLTNEGDLFANSRAPLCGNWPLTPGRYTIDIMYNSTPVAHVMINNDSC